MISKIKYPKCRLFGQACPLFGLHNLRNVLDKLAAGKARGAFRRAGDVGAATILYTSFSQVAGVEDRVVTLKLNQQQLELIDRTIAKGVAPDREALIRLALRELAAKRAEAPR